MQMRTGLPICWELNTYPVLYMVIIQSGHLFLFKPTEKALSKSWSKNGGPMLGQLLVIISMILCLLCSVFFSYALTGRVGILLALD